MKNQIIIFDTSLRDGEQSPGCSMNTNEKVKFALQLENLGVDVIEVGFVAASLGDYDAISAICSNLSKPIMCSLNRAVENDIKQAGKSLELAKHKRIHTFIATSKIHMQYKLKMKEDAVIKKAVDALINAGAKTIMSAIFKTIDKITKHEGILKDYKVNSVFSTAKAYLTSLNSYIFQSQRIKMFQKYLKKGLEIC